MAGEGKGLADRERRRSGVPKRALIAPLVMLVGGAAASVALWRFLMIMPPLVAPPITIVLNWQAGLPSAHAVRQ